MGRKYSLPAFMSIISSLIFCSCDQASNLETQYICSIQGVVYDSAAQTPVEKVKNFAADITDTAYSNAAGVFRFNNIQMPRSEKYYTIVTAKQGYDTCLTTIKAKSDETKYMDTIFIIKF